MKGVTHPNHRETVGKFCNQMWSVGTFELDALVEVIDGLSEPQANDQERGETDHKPEQTDPSSHPLDHGLFELGRQLAELGAEGNQCEQDEEDGREAQGNSDEAWGSGSGCR